MTPTLLFVVAALVGCGDVGVTGKEAIDYNAVTTVEAVIQAGQSNAQGTNIDPNGGNSPPRGIPESRISYLSRVPLRDDTNLQDLDRTVVATTFHSTELQMGLDLMASAALPTRAVAIVKAARGATFVTDWIEGGGDNARLQDAITEFKAMLQVRFPNATIRWHFTWNQGETEALNASSLPASAWASNFATLLSQVATYTGQSTIRPHIIRTWHSLASENWLSIVRSQQASAASAASGYLIDVDSTLDGNMQSDNVHWTGAGYNAVGALLAASIINDIATH